MKVNDIIIELSTLKWTPQEAELYLTLLHLGPQPASNVASHLNRNRLTTFHALKRLAKKGIVKTSMQPSGMHFTAIEPRALLNKVKQKKTEVISNAESQVRAMEWLLPHLEELEKRDFIRPKVQLFHGDEALKNIYEISLLSKHMYAYFEPWPQDTGKHLRDIDDWHTEERVKKKIPVQIIIPDTHEGKFFAAIQKDLKEVVVIPASQFKHKDLTLITDTCVLIFSLADKLGIAIESTQIARNQEAIFQLAWRGAQELSNP